LYTVVSFLFFSVEGNNLFLLYIHRHIDDVLIRLTTDAGQDWRQCYTYLQQIS